MSYEENAGQRSRGTSRLPSRARGALLLGAVVNALLAVVLLLLAWLYECLQLVHVLLGLLSGGTSVVMARAATDPGGDDDDDGTPSTSVDHPNP